jgi:hypothetical protein
MPCKDKWLPGAPHGRVQALSGRYQANIAKNGKGDRTMADDSDTVYPTGLTPRQAEEIQDGLMWGTRIYFGIAVFAHILAYIYSPWLHS